jgi:hypothetical protein
MFVALNEGHAGNLGGVSGANALCQTQAAAAGLGSSTWKAFLSSSAQNAKDLFTGANANLPVVNKAGVVMYASWTSLFVNNPTWVVSQYMLTFNDKPVDEITAVTPPWTDADGWHGTTATGIASPNTCLNWTSAALADSGIAGEWDFYSLLTQEVHTCDYTAAVGCVAIRP